MTRTEAKKAAMLLVRHAKHVDEQMAIIFGKSWWFVVAKWHGGEERSFYKLRQGGDYIRSRFMVWMVR